MEEWQPIRDRKKLGEAALYEIQRVAFADPKKPQLDLFGGQVVGLKEKLKALELLGKATGIFEKQPEGDSEACEIEGFETIEYEPDERQEQDHIEE